MLPVMTMQSALRVQPIEWLGLHRAYQNAGEMEVLVALARLVKARSMLEIGCRDGRTAKLLLRNVPTLERYVGVDVEPGYEPKIASQRGEMTDRPGELALPDPRFELVLRPRGSLDLTAGDFPERFDACYIDGDHSANVVLRDSMLALAVVRADGLIVWHDYGNASVEVTGVIDTLAESALKENLFIKQIERTWFAWTVLVGPIAASLALAGDALGQDNVMTAKS